MCSPYCGGYYSRLKKKLNKSDQILFQVERIKSTNYSLRVDVTECALNVQENGKSVFFNVQELFHRFTPRVGMLGWE